MESRKKKKKMGKREQEGEEEAKLQQEEEAKRQQDELAKAADAEAEVMPEEQGLKSILDDIEPLTVAKVVTFSYAALKKDDFLGIRFFC